MLLPAVTICISSMSDYLTNFTLDRALVSCLVGGTECGHEDFFIFETNLGLCYVLNSGRNSSSHSVDIKSTKNTGFRSGIDIFLILPKNHFVFFQVNDAQVKPTSSELNNIYALPGGYTKMRLEKNVETKLEFPYSACRDSEKFPDSAYVRQLNESKFTYRQANCFELCFHDFLKNSSTVEEAKFSNDFDYINNCGHLCPLECQSTSYRIIETEFKWSDFDASYFSNFINILDKNPNLDKKLDLKNLTAQQLSENMLGLVFYYDSLRYTQISQSPKTSLCWFLILVDHLDFSWILVL